MTEPDLPVVSSRYPIFAQVVVGFAFAVFISPYSIGIEFALGYLAAWEFLVFAVTRDAPEYYDPLDRLGVVAGYLLGWAVGRILAGQDIFSETPPRQPYKPPEIVVYPKTRAAKSFLEKYGVG
jgi:hypothetical protein